MNKHQHQHQQKAAERTLAAMEQFQSRRANREFVETMANAACWQFRFSKKLEGARGFTLPSPHREDGSLSAVVVDWENHKEDSMGEMNYSTSGIQIWTNELWLDHSDSAEGWTDEAISLVKNEMLTVLFYSTKDEPDDLRPDLIIIRDRRIQWA